jgi:hypothetical protein
MRVFIIILSILIFRQSVTVCMPSVQNVDIIGQEKKLSCKHSCCKKMQESTEKDGENSTQDNDHKCKCGSCKVISLSPVYVLKSNEILPSTLNFSYTGIKPVLTHSYDFHAKISYPPQV